MNPTLKQIVKSKVGDRLPPSAKFIHYSGGDFFHEVDVQDVHLIERAEKKTRAKYKPIVLDTDSTRANVPVYDAEMIRAKEGGTESEKYLSTIQWMFTKKYWKIVDMDPMTFSDWEKLMGKKYTPRQVVEKLKKIQASKRGYNDLNLTVQNYLKNDY